jgi:large subunit ribosomal protein L22
MSREEIMDKREELLETYKSLHSKSKKPMRLAKKEKRALGIGKDEGKAVLKYARISARKVKIVLDLIRYKELDEAYGILKHTPKAASEILIKLLKSAESNAVNNNELDRDSLIVSEAYANQGPTLKRIRARAQGRAFRIRKRTSHITLVVKEA